MVGLSSCCKKALQRGPLERAGSHIQQPIEAKETRQRDMPSARRRQFCLLLLPDKSSSAGGPRPAGSTFGLKERQRATFDPKSQSKTVGVARQQLHFLCSDKENESKRKLGAALGMSCSIALLKGPPERGRFPKAAAV